MPRPPVQPGPARPARHHGGKAPPVKRYTYVNKRTGEIQRIPEGVHPSFHYPPGGRQAHLDAYYAEAMTHIRKLLD